ncbi:MAG: hypothetical protein JWQ35_57 [Bacteriovoracaceae bacterium]|nr:hypothetical protein [Bacteriovoracaceae bacterium]
MSKNSEFSTTHSTEGKFDVRLTDKKIEHGFLTRQEKEQYLKSLPEEKDFDFTSSEALEDEITVVE